MRKNVIVGAAALLTALAFTGCRPPLMLNDSIPAGPDTHQAPAPKTSTDHPVAPQRCFHAPCP